jgi:putative transposase
MDKFKNKYRITTTRLQEHDYGKNGAYFITICTADRTHFFGEIANKKMQLNELGNSAHQLINEIPNQFTYAELGPFVVMPNHINKHHVAKPHGFRFTSPWRGRNYL